MPAQSLTPPPRPTAPCPNSRRLVAPTPAATIDADEQEDHRTPPSRCRAPLRSSAPESAPPRSEIDARSCRLSTPPTHRRAPLGHPDPRDYLDHTVESASITSTRISKGRSSIKMTEQHLSEDRLISSRFKRKGSPSQCDDDSEGVKEKIFSERYLSEDVWCHIHSLMDMQDAGRAACLSRYFLRSWRHHPYLIFNNETMGCKKNPSENNEITSNFYSRVDQILNNHSGIGVKTLKIEVPKDYTAKDSCYLNRWLQSAVTPGIEELMLTLPMKAKYNFPYSLLSRSGYSIRYLQLACCSFRPTAEFGWLKNLTKLHLRDVCIKGDELECLLLASLALERLEIRFCDRVVCLKVPSLLQRLSYLEVLGCDRLRVIDSDAPNISSFNFRGGPKVQLSLGEALQMKKLRISFPGAAHYVRVELPSSMPNLETVTIFSKSEMANTPMLHSKYLHLKNLRIVLMAFTFSPAFDYFSLASFFDACPSLETFVLEASQRKMEHVSIITDPSVLRRMPEKLHHKLKIVEILGFSSAKSLVELTCHIAECLTSLEFLKLEVDQSSSRCSVPDHKCSKCSPLPDDVLMEARRSLLAIRTYIEPKVPTTVKLHVVEPCSRCHALEL